MSQIAAVQLADGGSVEPLTLQQRKARGFCTCPLKMPQGSWSTPADAEPCGVHPKQVQQTATYNESHGLLFFDDRRNRYVTWEDAVEGMRQPRYVGASSKGLALFTWMNLVRMLEALCYPNQEPVVEITEPSAQHLIRWAGQNFPADSLSVLIGLARGGGTEGLCKIFRTMPRVAQDRLVQGKDLP